MTPHLIGEQLEKHAHDETVSVSTLLREALSAAKKLKDVEAEKWISNELKGYEDTSDVPSYRAVSGHPVAENPVRGWTPLITINLDAETAYKISMFDFRNPISEIENYAMGTVGTRVTEEVIVTYDKRAEDMLMRAMNNQYRPAIQFNRSQFKKITDIVRTKVLEWSLDLQKNSQPMPEHISQPEIAETTGVKGYLSKNKHWIFEGVGTQVIIWLGAGVVALITVFGALHWNKQPEVRQPTETKPENAIVPQATVAPLEKSNTLRKTPQNGATIEGTIVNGQGSNAYPLGPIEVIVSDTKKRVLFSTVIGESGKYKTIKLASGTYTVTFKQYVGNITTRKVVVPKDVDVVVIDVTL